MGYHIWENESFLNIHSSNLRWSFSYTWNLFLGHYNRRLCKREMSANPLFYGFDKHVFGKTISYQSHYVMWHLYDSNSTASTQTSILCIRFRMIHLNWLQHLSGLISYADRRNGRFHYNDVIMSAIASQITGVSIVAQLLAEAQVRRNIKAPSHLPLCGEFTGDRWIPRTKGQYRGKCSHLMTSSWHVG